MLAYKGQSKYASIYIDILIILYFVVYFVPDSTKHSSTTSNNKNQINYDLLMEHFKKIQNAHRENRLIQRKRSFLTNDC